MFPVDCTMDVTTAPMKIYTTTRLWVCALSTLLCPIGWAQSSLQLPDMGDPTATAVTTDDEERMGLEALRWLRSRQAIVEDVELTEYLMGIGQHLALHADNHGAPYRFFLIRDASINAFALPHNLIGIHSGLLLLTEQEDELAGVMAHEIAHVSQRHIARAIADMQRLTLPMAAAMVAGAALSNRAPQMGQAAMVGALAAGAQHQISFTRANEQEADRLGLQFLAKSGFDPAGMQRFFGKLERLSQGESRTKLPDLLLTHPRPERRMAEAEDRLPTPTMLSHRAPARDPWAYALAKARARVLTTEDNQALLRALQKGVSDRPGAQTVSAVADRYAYVLALQQAGQYDEAQQQVQKLLAHAPDRLSFRMVAAELALARGDDKAAFQRFADAQRLYPDDYTLALHYGQALAQQGDARLALRLLQPHARRRPFDPQLHTLLAQAAQRAGDRVAMHAALAESFAVYGEWLPAVEQINLALQQASITPQQESQCRARLQQLIPKVPPQQRFEVRGGRP